MNRTSFPCAAYIKEIGRGKDNPRDLTRDDAYAMWGAILDGHVSDMELGAILLALRVKGESQNELSGFLDATEQHLEKLPRPACSGAGWPVLATGNVPPVVIPSYNGARNMANLTPLLAMLLARQGVPVLVHGKTQDTDAAYSGTVAAPRTTTAEIFAAMGVLPARDLGHASRLMARGEPAFVSIAMLSPDLHRILMLRRVLGVRNSAHSLVKMLQPFNGPALRLASYTHPEYHDLLSDFYRHESAQETTLASQRGDVLLMRGTEGEVVANARRMARVEWIHEGKSELLLDSQEGVLADIPILPETRNAAATAVWIQAVLSGERPVPDAIERQIKGILEVLDIMRRRLAQPEEVRA